jgi:hypothetical protein
MGGKLRACWVCVIAALVLALVWLLSVVTSGFAAPSWVAPASVLALALAVLLSLIP